MSLSLGALRFGSLLGYRRVVFLEESWNHVAGARAMTRFACWLGVVLVGIGASSLFADEPSKAPDGWRTYAARSEIAPKFWVEREVPDFEGHEHAYALGLSGQGNAAVDGRWVRTVKVEPKKHYQFTAQFQAQNVVTRERSVLARVIWLDEKGNRVETPEYPVTQYVGTPDGWTVVAATYQAPEKATQAKLELHLRWAPEGEVRWKHAGLVASSPPAPRLVKLAAVNHRPKNTKSSSESVEQFVKLVAEAAAKHADIVCLPEGITVVGTPFKYADVAEPVPGPTTKRLGEAAREGHCYIVAGVYEREGSVIYNTSVLMDREGKLAGKYRKVCLPREEIDGGITPGHEYPVFDTDFGRIGMMICWDVHFPEVARELSARGAEVILMPIWGGNVTLAKARAIENQIILVTSGYDFKTAIFDKDGEALAEMKADPEVLVTEVDLADRRYWPWLGDWRARIWREGPARSPSNYVDFLTTPTAR